MSGSRLVRHVYEEGRARLELDAGAKTWCNLTRMWLQELGFQAEWNAQAVGEDWPGRLRKQIMRLEERRWRHGVENNVRLVGYAKWKKVLTTEAELYLKVRHEKRRRLWTKLRGGCLELRVETGRWETIMMRGKQVMLPRGFRMCTLCFEEVEDEEHTLFRCPSFKRIRTEFLEGCGLAEEEQLAAREVLCGQRQGIRVDEVDDERWSGA